jgi:hypothetical protein
MQLEAEESPLLRSVTRKCLVSRLKRLSVCCSDLQSVEIGAGFIVICSYDL